MTSEVANFVGMTVTGAPGTGTITLGQSIQPGSLSFASAYSKDTIVDLTYVDGNHRACEVGCIYNYATNTITRGTTETSTTGATLSLTNKALVFVSLPASKVNTITQTVSDIEIGTLNSISQKGISPSYVVVSPTKANTPTIASHVNITGNIVNITTETVDGESWLKFTAISNAPSTTTGFVIQFNTPFTYPAACDSAIVEMIPPAPVGSPYMLSLGTAGGYAVQASNARWGIGAASSTDALGIVGARTQACFHRTEINRVATGYTGESILQPFNVCKLTVYFSATAAASTPLTFYLRSITLGGAARKGRLAIIADDGYASWFQQGVPILERRGLRSTASIIPPDGVNGIGFSSLFTTEAALQAYVASGNACVAHGPSYNTPNLYTGPYSGGATVELNAARIADMNFARDWLLERGLTSEMGAKCYVWPQGYFNAGSGETSLLDAAYAAGYRLGRTAIAYPNNNAAITTSNYERFTNLRALSPRSHWRLIVPIIGHSYFGAASTPDDTTETTAVNALIQVIQNLADSGMDAMLMLHKVVPKGQATVSTEIEVDRLDAIAAACQSLVNSGQLEVVTMPEMVTYA